MKKVLSIIAGFILGIYGLSLADIVYQYSGSPQNIRTKSCQQVSVSSTTTTTIAALNTGVIRYIQNNGTGDVYVGFSSSSTVTTNGWILKPQVIWVEDHYFGSIYMKSSSTTNVVSVEQFDAQI